MNFNISKMVYSMEELERASYGLGVGGRDCPSNCFKSYHVLTLKPTLQHPDLVNPS